MLGGKRIAKQQQTACKSQCIFEGVGFGGKLVDLIAGLLDLLLDQVINIPCLLSGSGGFCADNRTLCRCNYREKHLVLKCE